MTRNMFIQSGELVTILGGKKRRRNRLLCSLRFRIIVLLLLFGIIPCLVIRGSVLKSYEDRTVSVRMAEIQNQCTILSDQLANSDYMTQHNAEQIDVELSQLSTIYSARVMVIDDSFRIIKDTYQLDEGKTIVSEDVIRCYKKAGTSYYDAKNRYMEITVPITSAEDASTIGVMLMSVSADNILDSMDVLRGKTNIITVTIVVILLALSYLIGMLIVRPFSRITSAIEEITEGYGTDELKEYTYYETVKISDAFNKMRNRFKVLDDSRQEFVSNVSHELKTPITSMKVLADSLLAQKDAPIEMYQEFMQDMSDEIEREDKIINDLLSLVKMDKTAKGLNIKNENINELTERILKRLRPIAAQRNIEVVFESFRPVLAEVDEVMLTLALSNLIENAIKYNKDEGWVHVSLNADHKFCYIKVVDSGYGIPKDSLDSIFERFYRVDKSHSREIGGTGLGLAIARNAVVMHRGAIKVFSEEGEGTTFTVRVPLTYVAK